ncbi:MAG: PorT family protein, partial [Melioribacteraceae bacterium]|nr:PorT family protein [Melioribacteraceae bacterium]
MKKLLIISSIALLCAFTSNINAQFNIGPIAGLNVSNLDVKDNDLSSVWNWGAGIVTNYYFTENIAVQLEPMYLLKGGVVEAKEGDPRFDISLSYIEVPILFKYDFGKKENFYLLAGLSV